jgi:hypothetical protein
MHCRCDAFDKLCIILLTSRPSNIDQELLINQDLDQTRGQNSWSHRSSHYGRLHSPPSRMLCRRDIGPFRGTFWALTWEIAARASHHFAALSPTIRLVLPFTPHQYFFTSWRTSHGDGDFCAVCLRFDTSRRRNLFRGFMQVRGPAHAHESSPKTNIAGQHQLGAAASLYLNCKTSKLLQEVLSTFAFPALSWAALGCFCERAVISTYITCSLFTPPISR